MFTWTDITQVTMNTTKGVAVGIIKINQLYHIQVVINGDEDETKVKEFITRLKRMYGGEPEYKGFVKYGFLKYSKAYLLNIECVDEDGLGVELPNHHVRGSDKIKAGA